MLILTRNINETIMIGEGDDLVKVSILGVRGGQVRLGIDAAGNIPVHREEIYERILLERCEDKERTKKDALTLQPQAVSAA